MIRDVWIQFYMIRGKRSMLRLGFEYRDEQTMEIFVLDHAGFFIIILSKSIFKRSIDP